MNFVTAPHAFFSGGGQENVFSSRSMVVFRDASSDNDTGIALDKQHYPCSHARDDGSCRDHDAVSSTSALLSSSVFPTLPSLVEWDVVAYRLMWWSGGKKMSSPVGRWSFPEMRARITTRGIALDKQHYPCSR
ncbi:hypothetical protein CEXT_792361 [Caerostris extrusa]|uniref:Uncharacterized protein n=1 Tax=Caerostris extrusa TaxID=172846 RepID=A0AAV4TF95_CAEEX|nr:hypothetical protein CEXT_792361 [Caerostris extrusa]